MSYILQMCVCVKNDANLVAEQYISKVYKVQQSLHQSQEVIKLERSNQVIYRSDWFILTGESSCKSSNQVDLTVFV